MVCTSSSTGEWSCIPYDVLEKILDVLSRQQSRRQSATVLYSVNKHWRDAIRQTLTVLNPRKGRPFKFSRDAAALSKFPNLHTLILKETTNKAQTKKEQKKSRRLHGFQTEEGIDDRVHRALTGLKKLKHLTIENVDNFEIYLKAFGGLPSLERLALEQGCLNEAALKRLSLMSCLTHLTMTSMDIASNDSFLAALRTFDRLRSLELSSVKGIVLSAGVVSTYPKMLETLSIHRDNFNWNKACLFSSLKNLKALTIDGQIDGDRVDLSCLSHLTYLSFRSSVMPLWIQEMDCLVALKLETDDAFLDDRRRNALLTVAPRLIQLQIVMEKAPRSFVHRVVSAAKKLEKLHVTGDVDCRSLSNRRLLKEASIERGIHRSVDEIYSIDGLGQLPLLTSLKVNLGHSMLDNPFGFLERSSVMTRNLTKLVVHWAQTSDVVLFVSRLPRLQDLRLLDGAFGIFPFVFMSSEDLPNLKNLCLFSRCFERFEECVSLFFSLSVLMNLEHLALPKVFVCQWRRFVQAFKETAPQVLVDYNMHWESQAFQIQS